MDKPEHADPFTGGQFSCCHYGGCYVEVTSIIGFQGKECNYKFPQ